MKIEGRITGVRRDEHPKADENHQLTGEVAIYTYADVTWDRASSLFKPSELALSGYEPHVTFKIGQRVTLMVEDV